MGRNSPSLSSKKRKVAPTINKIAPTVDKAVATIDNSAADQDNPVPKSILSKTSSAEIGLSPGQRLSLDVVSSPPRRGSSPSPGLPSSGPNSGNSPGPSRKKFGSNRSFSTNSLNSSHSNSQHNSHSYSHGHSLSHSHSNSLNSNVDNATVNSGKSSKKRRNSQSTLFTSVESIRSRDNENDDDLESNYTATVSNKNSKYVAPLEIPLQKKIIVEEIGNHVDELRMAEMLERKIVLSTLVCLISNVIGVIMVLYALQLTDAFASARDNYPLFYASLVFFTPTLVFIRIVFLPG